MPKKPKRKVRRIVCRTAIRRLQEGEYHIRCWDQTNERYQEADELADDRESATLRARQMVNKSHYV